MLPDQQLVVVDHLLEEDLLHLNRNPTYPSHQYHNYLQVYLQLASPLLVSRLFVKILRHQPQQMVTSVKILHHQLQQMGTFLPLLSPFRRPNQLYEKRLFKESKSTSNKLSPGSGVSFPFYAIGRKLYLQGVARIMLQVKGASEK